MPLDDVQRIAVALAVLRRRERRIDGEALAWLLQERWGREVTERALVLGLGLTCGADDACSRPAAPDPERLDAMRAVLARHGMADLVEGPRLTLVD